MVTTKQLAALKKGRQIMCANMNMRFPGRRGNQYHNELLKARKRPPKGGGGGQMVERREASRSRSRSRSRTVSVHRTRRAPSAAPARRVRSTRSGREF